MNAYKRVLGDFEKSLRSDLVKVRGMKQETKSTTMEDERMPIL